MAVDVLVILGSKSDAEVGKKAGSILAEFGVEYEMVVASAHRTPDLLRDLIRNTTARVFIGVAGLSAALPGTIAAHTTKPVIGVPVSGKLNLDAVLSVSQMPPGVPVAAVGLDRGENAGILAVEILALKDERLAEKLKDHRDAMKKWVLEDSRTLGECLLAVYVDTGLMRKDETEDVARTLKELKVNHRILRAADEFFAALRGISDPEKKRVIIGNKFIELFEREAKTFGADHLVQGTIAPDWIESGGQLRDRIKTHHNVAGLPPNMKLKLVEPLRDLYKDEVRTVARTLGVGVAERQPFPGPGLAVRIVGEVTPEKTVLVREASAIVEHEIEVAAKDKRVPLPWQYFAVLLPVQTVGVHGDLRVYGQTIAVRAVDSIDGMSAVYSKIPHEVLDRISIRITNEVPGINRVVYDVSNKPPATIEWE